MSNDLWGPGDQVDAVGFDRTLLGKDAIELFFGQHPHSRRDNNIYARTASGTVFEFDGHRILIDFVIRSENYLKTSDLSGDEIRKGGTGKIYFNGKQVYEFFFRDPMRACHQAARYAEILLEHPLQIWNPKEHILGRKVWYRNDPAVITMLIKDQGCVILEPDGIGAFAKRPWRNNDWDDDGDSSVKIDIVQDQNVWWWRDAKS